MADTQPGGAGAQPASPAAVPITVASPTTSAEEPSIDVDMAEEGEEDEEADETDLLQQALSMSLAPQDIASDDVDMSELSEEQQLALAMQMSMQSSQPSEDKPAQDIKTEPSASQPAAANEPAPEDIQAILANLPGVDPDSPEVKVRKNGFWGAFEYRRVGLTIGDLGLIRKPEEER